MAAPVLNSVSPALGPPGTVIACLGSGFDAGAQVGCPALAETTFVGAGELGAAIPADLVGPAGGSAVVSVFVQNEDGSRSAIVPFTVNFPYPASTLQSWTNVEAVCGEIPGFRRGGRIQDSTIEGWMRSIAQTIAGAMLRRGLSLDSAQWQQPDAATAMPTPAGVLELINRYGAAVRLASAIAGDFTSGEWGLAKSLTRDFERELKALQDGGYDKLFRPGATTVESGPQFSGGDIVTDQGDAQNAFSKDQVF
jgi:hypothetical protein